MIRTTAQYLQFVPDARAIGMGQVGAASSPDVHSMHWNPAKYAFLENRFGIGVSYSDVLWMNWARNKSLGDGDFDLSTGFIVMHSYFSFQERHTLAFSLKSFSWREITLTDEFGNELGTYTPYEMSVDVAYSYRFSPSFSAALATRYIHSNLTQGQFVQGQDTYIGRSVAFDMAVYYQKPLELGSRDGEIRWGVDISNIGMKMSYIEDDEDKNFLPTNFRIGAGFTCFLDENNSLSIQIDANKLLVPTPPVYLRDSMGVPVYDDDGKPVIAEGKNPNVSVCRGMVQSWYDAPGGFQEELHEWMIAGGLEYRFKTIFSLRSGVLYENKTKGNRQFFTFGGGFGLGPFSMNLGLQVPLNRKLTDDYISIIYLRTSLAINISGKGK